MQQTPECSSSQEREGKHLNSNPTSSPSSSSSTTRLWKPAAQRNLRNQWSKLLSHRDSWISASSNGRAHATSLVNAHLSLRYMPKMNLGVLSEMSGIRHKACEKLALQQEQYQRKLLSCYKDMVDVVSHMTNVCNSMRCFLKGSTGSPLVHFGTHPEDGSDAGDGGGIPVFSSLSIPSFEILGQELLRMYVLELSLKRLLVVELLSLSCKESLKGQNSRSSWSDELYQGEFDDLSAVNLYCDKQCQPIAPRIIGWESGNPTSEQTYHLPDHENLQQGALVRFSSEMSHDSDIDEDGEYETAVAAASFVIAKVEAAESQASLSKITSRNELEPARKWGGNWLWRQNSCRTSTDSTSSGEDHDFDTAVAAATFAVATLKEAESEASPTKTKSIQHGRDGLPAPASGEDPKRKPELVSWRPHANAITNQQKRQTERATTTRTKKKADDWEKSEMAKIKKRYEKQDSTILSWENDKKAKARLRLDKVENGVDSRKAEAKETYEREVAKIDMIAREATEAERKVNDEFKVKKKANKIRSRRGGPLTCFCF